MPAVAKQPTEQKIVSVMLSGGRVTQDFRASLFAAAGRSGKSVNEFVLLAAAEKLKAAGAPFSGVFRSGDLTSEGSADVFAGSSDRTVLHLGDQFVTEGELAALQKVRPGRLGWGSWAVELMKDAVLSHAGGRS